MSILVIGPGVTDGRSVDDPVMLPSDVECISMQTCEYDQTAYPLEAEMIDTFEIHSNGTAMRQLEVNTETTLWNETKWYPVPATAFEDIIETMCSEGFCSMEERYFDAKSTLAYPATCTLTARGLPSNMSVVFESEMMMGIMPETYFAIRNAIHEDIRVDLAIVEVSSPEYEVSCTVVNDGDTNFTFGSCNEDIWFISVMRDNGCRFNDPPTVLPTCVVTLEPHEVMDFEPMEFNASGLPDGSYSVFMDIGRVGLASLTIEGNDAYVNTAPTCHGSRISQGDDTSDSWTVELIGCCDLEDRQEDLLVRWDYESDGVWDSDWSSEKSASGEFDGRTEVTVTYEIKDTAGEVTVDAVVVSDDAVFIQTSSNLLVLVAGVALAVVVIVLATVILTRRRGPGQ